VFAVKRLAHATLTTPDLERQIDYYTEVLGLVLIARDSARAHLATQTGLEAVVLETGVNPGVDRVALQLSPGTDLSECCAHLSQFGIEAERRTDPTPGVREMIAFQDPQGRGIEMFADYSFAPPSSFSPGVQPHKLGHVAFHTPDLELITTFYRDVLGFKLSDQRSNFFAFLRCSREHHALNFLQAGNHARVNHLAFELRDHAEINRACDVLAQHKLPLFWGPVRHVIGHNVAIYHKNPDGLAVEMFADLDVMLDEDLGYFEPRSWHQDRPQRPKIWGDDTPTNYWGPEFGVGGNGTKRDNTVSQTSREAKRD